MKRWGILVLAVAIAACGGTSNGAGPAASVSGTNGPFHAVASPGRLAPGGSVSLVLTVSGPIQYETGCVQTLHIWVEDGRQQQVWSQPVPAIQCMALGYKSLAAGETETFTAQWPTSSQLSPGLYTLHGLFLTVLPAGAGTRVRENLPVLTIHISS